MKKAIIFSGIAFVIAVGVAFVAGMQTSLFETAFAQTTTYGLSNFTGYAVTEDVDTGMQYYIVFDCSGIFSRVTGCGTSNVTTDASGNFSGNAPVFYYTTGYLSGGTLNFSGVKLRDAGGGLDGSVTLTSSAPGYPGVWSADVTYNPNNPDPTKKGVSIGIGGGTKSFSGKSTRPAAYGGAQAPIGPINFSGVSATWTSATTILPPVATAPSVGVSVLSRTSSSANIKGEIINPGTLVGGGVATIVSKWFNIYYGSSGAFKASVDATNIPLSSAGGFITSVSAANLSFLEQVAGLNAGTAYLVEAKATNSAGEEGESGQVPFTTLPQTYTLTVNKSGNGNGTIKDSDGITITPGAQFTLNAGASKTFTATPTSGTFSGWSWTGTGTEGCTGTTNPCVLTMDGNKTVTATFSTPGTIITTPTAYTLTVNKAGVTTGATITTSGNSNVSSGATYQLAEGGVKSFTAVPASGGSVSWNGCTSTSNSGKTCSVTMPAETKTITATFSAPAPAYSSPNAILSASPLSGNAPLTVNFSGAGSSGGTYNGTVYPITSYRWEFNDNSNDFERTSSDTFSKVYSTPGTYTVKLRVISGYGTSDYSNTVTITVGQRTPTPTPTPTPPTASISGPTSAQINQTVTFTAGGNYGQTYSWTFGDGTSGSGASVTKAYTADGPFTVTLTITNSDGSATANHTINVSTPAQSSIIINPWHKNVLAIREKLNMQVDNYPVSWSDGGSGGSFSNGGSTDGGTPVTYTAPSTPQNVTVTATRSSLGSSAGTYSTAIVEPYYFSCASVSSTAVQVNWTRRFSDPATYENHTLTLDGNSVTKNNGFAIKSVANSPNPYTFTLGVNYTAGGIRTLTTSCTTNKAESKTPSELKAFATLTSTGQPVIYLNWKDNSTLTTASTFDIQRIALDLKTSTNLSATPTGPNSIRIGWKNSTISTPYYVVFQKGTGGSYTDIKDAINVQYDPMEGKTIAAPNSSFVYYADKSLNEWTTYSYLAARACSAIPNIDGMYVKADVNNVNMILNDKGSITPPCGPYTSSDMISVTTPPSQPTNLQATRVDANRRTITWNDVSTKNTSYKISRNGYLVDTLSGSATAFNDTGLSPDKAYVYTISACVGSNCSSVSKVLPDGSTADATASIETNANQIALPLTNVQPLASQISNDLKISRGNEFFASMYSTIIKEPAKAIIGASKDGFTFFAEKINGVLEQTGELLTAHGESTQGNFFSTIKTGATGASYKDTNKDTNITPGIVYVYRVRYVNGATPAWSNLTATKALSAGTLSTTVTSPICTGNSFCDSTIKKGNSSEGLSEKQCSTNSDCRNVGRYGQSYIER